MATSSRQPASEGVAGAAPRPVEQTAANAGGGVVQLLVLLLVWASVGLPLAWGVQETLHPTLELFR